MIDRSRSLLKGPCETRLRITRKRKKKKMIIQFGDTLFFFRRTIFRSECSAVSFVVGGAGLRLNQVAVRCVGPARLCARRSLWMGGCGARYVID